MFWLVEETARAHGWRVARVAGGERDRRLQQGRPPGRVALGAHRRPGGTAGGHRRRVGVERAAGVRIGDLQVDATARGRLRPRSASTSCRAGWEANPDLAKCTTWRQAARGSTLMTELTINPEGDHRGPPGATSPSTPRPSVPSRWDASSKWAMASPVSRACPFRPSISSWSSKTAPWASPSTLTRTPSAPSSWVTSTALKKSRSSRPPAGSRPCPSVTHCWAGW